MFDAIFYVEKKAFVLVDFGNCRAIVSLGDRYGRTIFATSSADGPILC